MVAEESGSPRRLHRGLLVLGTLLITLSAITPASSVFIIAPGVMATAGTGAVASFLAAGVVGIFMAFVYAELSSAFPLTGGEYAIVGRTLGRLPGFMIMILIGFTNLLILAVIALGVGIYLGVVFPGLPAAPVAAVTCLLAAAFAVLDIKFNAVLTGIFLAIEMLALAAVCVLGFGNAHRSVGELLTAPVVAGTGGGLSPASLGVIVTATAVAIFAYNGYGGAVYFGEETENASRNIARAILWALGITVAVELIPVTAVLVGAPDLGELFGAPNMMAHFLDSVGGPTLSTLVSLGIAVAIVNAVLAILLMVARMLFSSGRDQAWPAPMSAGLRALHPRFGTPWVATLVAGAIAAAVCFLDEKLLLVLTGTALVVVYFVLCVAALNGRRTGSTAHGSYRMPLFPLPPLLAMAALAYVGYVSATDPEIGRPSLIVTAVVLVVAAAYYLLWVRRRGGWVMRDGSSDESTSRATTT
ncbi:APC family permease [Pseudonocardia eucalypti]|uniref:APC family permease n=1 Tax=Pseudonocardia eucalypti TaxID=648755 RepID=A0ABP9Q586_9PSEU|nr:amino acid transporter [Pseudonocardia eucalypti]